MGRIIKALHHLFGISKETRRLRSRVRRTDKPSTKKKPTQSMAKQSKTEQTHNLTVPRAKKRDKGRGRKKGKAISQGLKQEEEASNSYHVEPEIQGVGVEIIDSKP